MKRFRILFSAAFFSVSPIVSTSVFALSTDEFNAYIIDMPLDEVLSVLHSEMNVQFSGDRNSRIRISDLQLNGTQEEVIDVVMRQARMDHFTFNGQVYFAPVDGRAVRLIPLDENVTADQAREALTAAGLNIPGYDISDVSNGRVLVLSGPVRYLALSEGVLGALIAVPDLAEAPVRVRRGGVVTAAGTEVAGAITVTN